jgi:hypothetical protein
VLVAADAGEGVALALDGHEGGELLADELLHLGLGEIHEGVAIELAYSCADDEVAVFVISKYSLRPAVVKLHLSFQPSLQE